MHALLVYDEDTVTVYSLMSVNNGTKIAGTYVSSSPTVSETQYTGKLVYIISDAGYYHLELNEPAIINGTSHEYIHFPGYKDGELTEHVGSTVTVKGSVEEDCHGLMCMCEPTILSVENSDPERKDLEQKLYQMGFESIRGDENQTEAEQIANAYFSEKESDTKYLLYGKCDSLYGGKLTGGYLYLPVVNGKMTVESEFLYVYPYDNVIYQGYFMSEYYCVWKDGVIERRREISTWMEQLLGTEVSCGLTGDPVYCVSNLNDEWFSVSWDGSKVYYHGSYLSEQGAEIYPTDTIGYFSSNQDAVHKCIFCSAEAYLNGERWTCNSCNREYSLDTVAEKVDFDTFKTGTWWDVWSQRCTLKIDILDDYTISVEINWSSSASENTKWTMIGTWDSETALLSYENGVKKTIVYSEGGTEQVVDSYDDGSGIFYFASGYLHWLDLKEAVGFDCMFEFPEY